MYIYICNLKENFLRWLHTVFPWYPQVIRSRTLQITKSTGALSPLHTVAIVVIHLNELSVQFSSVAQSCPTLCDPMNCSMPGLPVHHQLPEFTQTHIHQVSDAIQPSHPLSSPSPPAANPSQHWKEWSWNSSTLVTSCEELTHWKWTLGYL